MHVGDVGLTVNGARTCECSLFVRLTKEHNAQDGKKKSLGSKVAKEFAAAVAM